jgi:hypothetical protein
VHCRCPSTPLTTTIPAHTITTSSFRPEGTVLSLRARLLLFPPLRYFRRTGAPLPRPCRWASASHYRPLAHHIHHNTTITTRTSWLAVALLPLAAITTTETSQLAGWRKSFPPSARTPPPYPLDLCCAGLPWSKACWRNSQRRARRPPPGLPTPLTDWCLAGLCFRPAGESRCYVRAHAGPERPSWAGGALYLIGAWRVLPSARPAAKTTSICCVRQPSRARQRAVSSTLSPPTPTHGRRRTNLACSKTRQPPICCARARRLLGAGERAAPRTPPSPSTCAVRPLHRARPASDTTSLRRALALEGFAARGPPPVLEGPAAPTGIATRRALH